jgi:hypothetical protein
MEVGQGPNWGCSTKEKNIRAAMGNFQQRCGAAVRDVDMQTRYSTCMCSSMKATFALHLHPVRCLSRYLSLTKVGSVSFEQMYEDRRKIVGAVHVGV